VAPARERSLRHVWSRDGEDGGVTTAGDDETFEAVRPELRGRAYRMLGTHTDADDVIQEAWLRWHAADRADVVNPAAWLSTVVTRLALDRLRRRTREQARYVGPWLPSPVLQELPSTAPDPAAVAELADSLTTGFLLMLEILTPDERAAFLMADVFNEPSDTIAHALERSPEACRQLASRARRKLRDAHDLRRDGARAAAAVAARFSVAIMNGDEATALACLAEQPVYISDGGADRHAARRPIHQPRQIVRLFVNLYRRMHSERTIEAAVVGGYPGLVFRDQHGITMTLSSEVVDGRIVRLLSQANPTKLNAALSDPIS
jgi:RNA polymerase sigma-70 factor (ECF subfamily)